MSSPLPRVTEPVSSPLELLLACAHHMLDPATPESRRRELEPRLLQHLDYARALGLFELFEARDPALRALLADELANRQRHQGRTAGGS